MSAREALSALVATLPRCGGDIGADDAESGCRVGNRHLATWGKRGDRYCDEHHTAGWGEDELPYANALRIAVAVLAQLDIGNAINARARAGAKRVEAEEALARIPRKATLLREIQQGIVDTAHEAERSAQEAELLASAARRSA